MNGSAIGGKKGGSDGSIFSVYSDFVVHWHRKLGLERTHVTTSATATTYETIHELNSSKL